MGPPPLQPEDSVSGGSVPPSEPDAKIIPLPGADDSSPEEVVKGAMEEAGYPLRRKGGVLDGVRGISTKWVGRCPYHNGASDDSLVLFVHEDGHVWPYCFECSKVDTKTAAKEILGTVGLKLRDCYPAHLRQQWTDFWPEIERRVIGSGDTSVARMALEECVAVFRKWLHMPDSGPLLVTLATMVANQVEGDPLWLLIVGPPSGGKTETLMPLARLPEVRLAATLTVSALLSGVPKKEAEAGAKGGLLREIGDFGYLVLKDFGSVLSMQRDARAELLAALREIYDGSWTRHVGTGGGRTLAWQGKLGLLAGCTAAIDSHHTVMASLGERFLLYRLPTVDGDTQAEQALSHVGQEKAMREELAQAVRRVLAAADLDRAKLPADPDTTRWLVKLSTLAVRCRSAVERHSYHRDIELIPEPEAPARMVQTLYRLLNGLLAIRVQAEFAQPLVAKVALDSMPALRLAVIRPLMSAGIELDTTAVATHLGYPSTTVRRTLEELAAHGLVHRRSEGQGKPDRWQATKWARERWPATSPEKAGDMSISQPQHINNYISGEGPSVEQTATGEWRLHPPSDKGGRCCEGLWVTREHAVLHAQSHGWEISS